MEYCKLDKNQSVNIKILPRSSGKTTAAMKYIIENNLKEEDILFITVDKNIYKKFYSAILNFNRMNVLSFKEFSDKITDMTFELFINTIKQYKLLVFDDIAKKEALVYAIGCYLVLPNIKIIFLANRIE